MRLRQEQIVFVVAVLLLGFLFFRQGSTGENPGGSRRGADKELERHGVRTPVANRASDLPSQELFSPPRDTRPLPPLPFVEPPMPDLLALAPPPAPGVEPSNFGALLRTQRRVTEVDDLFEDEDLGDEYEDEGDDEGLSDIEVGDGIDPSMLEADERRELEALYRKLYDTLELNDIPLMRGRITNEDPYGLKDAARLNEPIRFVEVEPASGKDRYPGQPPIAFERTRVRKFALAETAENAARQAYHDLPAAASPATWREMMELADRCIELRYEFGDALGMAGELFRRVAAFRPEDPDPILGLVRVHEAAFEYEEAFTEAELAVERFGFRPEPHVAMARLERAFLMVDRAEASLRKAVEVERGTWVASAAFGEYLVDRGRFAEAVPHLRRAYERLPADSGVRDARERVKSAYAAAMLGAGDVTGALEMYAANLRANPEDQRAIAGVVACELVGADVGAVDLPEWATDGASVTGAPTDLAFELLVNRGIVAIAAGDFEAALRDLRAAARKDPLRAAQSLRAQSWLAECSGSHDKALDLAQSALEAKPGDTWSLLQRGRLLLDVDDWEGAEESLRAALEDDAELEDALAMLGWLEYRREHHAAAERYFERALRLSEGRGDTRADLWLRRAVNLVSDGAVIEAREAAQRALEAEPQLAVATGVRAWCAYLLGNAEEAVIQLRQMDDQLRNRPETDPLRIWATAQIERINDHLTKVVRIEQFEYSTVGVNGWYRSEAAGPRATLVQGVLHLGGTFDTSGEARYYQTIASAEFLAIEANVWVSKETNARAGLFVSRETVQSRDRANVQGMVGIARSRDGLAQVRVFQTSRPDSDWEDLPAESAPFAPDSWHRLRIERDGEGSDATVSVFLDGIPVVDSQRFSGFGTGTRELTIGLFVEGDTGRQADVRMDDVEITMRTSAKR